MDCKSIHELLLALVRHNLEPMVWNQYRQ